MRMSPYRGVPRGAEHAGASRSHSEGRPQIRIRNMRIRMGESFIEFSFKDSCAFGCITEL